MILLSSFLLSLPSAAANTESNLITVTDPSVNYATLIQKLKAAKQNYFNVDDS